MVTSIFISALGQAIFESCGQALLIYIALQLAVQFFPGITAKYKYDINYLGLTIITCWFLANLVNIYLHDVAISRYAIVSCSSTLIYGLKQMPTLLQQAEALISKYAYYIAGLYMLGLLLHTFKLIGGFMHIHYIRKKKNLSNHAYWGSRIVQLAKQLEVVKKVSLYLSAQVQIPLTIGYLRPIIIFPMALINNLEAEQVEAILLHELAHIKRHDYLLNILQCIMETILCFNPFVWLISKTIRQEREYCCDDMVMDADYNNFTYSKALYIIASQNKENYSLAMASAGSKKYPLLNRIKRLNTMKTENDTLPKFHLLIIITVAAISALLAWGIPQYSQAKAHKTVHTQKDMLPKPLKKNLPLPVIPPPSPAEPPAPSSEKVTIAFSRDTLTNNISNDTTVAHAKTRFKIVIDDGNGNKKEYNSLEELPEADKTEFMKENPDFGGLTFKFNDSVKIATIENLKTSPEWRKMMLDSKIQAKRIQMQMNSPQWKKQMAEMQLQTKKMAKQVNSAEWKKQMAEMQANADEIKQQMNSPEWKKQMADLKLQAEKMTTSPEWKKQMADLKLQAEKMTTSPQRKKQMAEIQLQSKRMAEQMNSPEFRKQMKEMQEKIIKEMDIHFNSDDAITDSIKTSSPAKP